MPTAMPAISRAVRSSLVSQPVDIVSTQISRTSISATQAGIVETGDEKCTETTPAENPVYEPKASACADGKTMTAKPLTGRMCSQLHNKRLRGPSAGHNTEQHEAEGSPRASNDPEYYPATCYEPEDDSDRQSSEKNQPPRKRHRSRFVSAKTKSPSQEIVQRESAGLDEVSQLVSITSDGAYNIKEPINTMFNE